MMIFGEGKEATMHTCGLLAQSFTNAGYPDRNVPQAKEQLREAHLLFDQKIITSVSRVAVLALSNPNVSNLACVLVQTR